MTPTAEHSSQSDFLPPSRHSNPFATCWTRPGALAFQFPRGTNAEQLVAQLAAQNWQGEIVGPHGAGKSSLLEALKPMLAAAGRRVFTATLPADRQRLPHAFVRSALAQPFPLIIVDGYEQLPWLDRALLRWQCRGAAAGLLVTAHAPTGLPILFRVEPDLATVRQLVATLIDQVSSPITAADVAASHACHGSNVRELFFALYDRHERASRVRRTAADSAA